MKNDSHICNDEVGQFSKLSHALSHIWQIAKAVLSGYLSGQPIDEERPRKGCC